MQTGRDACECASPQLPSNRCNSGNAAVMVQPPQNHPFQYRRASSSSSRSISVSRTELDTYFNEQQQSTESTCGGTIINAAAQNVDYQQQQGMVKATISMWSPPPEEVTTRMW